MALVAMGRNNGSHRMRFAPMGQLTNGREDPAAGLEKSYNLCQLALKINGENTSRIATAVKGSAVPTAIGRPDGGVGTN